MLFFCRNAESALFRRKFASCVKIICILNYIIYLTNYMKWCTIGMRPETRPKYGKEEERQ